MLAGLFLDISIIALLVIFIILGIKQGYRGTVLHTICSIFLTIAGAAGVGFVTAYFFGKGSGAYTGVLDSMTAMVEGSEWLYDKLGMTAAEIGKFLTFGVFFVIGFVVGLVLVGLLLFLIYHLLNKLRNLTWFRVIDNTVAVIINVAIYLVIVVVILALINCLEGTTVLVSLREFIKSTYVTRFIYNVIGEVLNTDMGGQTLRETIKIGHFAQLIFG